MFLKFEINDNEYLRRKWENEGIPADNIKNLLSMSDAPKFDVVITMYGRKNKFPAKIKLINSNGRELSIGKCSEYQTSIIETCKKYFKSPNRFTKLPFGVISVDGLTKAVKAS